MPIMRAFILFITICSPLVVSIAYLNIIKHKSLNTPLMQALVNVRCSILFAVFICIANFQCLYINTAIYNMFATVYLMFGLPSMRARLRADFRRIIGRRFDGGETQAAASQDGANAAERAAVELDNHFVYLRSAWL